MYVNMYMYVDKFIIFKFIKIIYNISIYRYMHGP